MCIVQSVLQVYLLAIMQRPIVIYLLLLNAQMTQVKSVKNC